MSDGRDVAALRAALEIAQIHRAKAVVLTPSPSGLMIALQHLRAGGVAQKDVIAHLDTTKGTLYRWARGIGVPDRPRELGPLFEAIASLFDQRIIRIEHDIKALEKPAKRPQPQRRQGHHRMPGPR